MLTNRNCKLGRPIKPISVNKRWYAVRILSSGEEFWRRCYGYKLAIFQSISELYPHAEDIEIYVLSPVKNK